MSVSARSGPADPGTYRRANGLVMRWIDDDPTHRLVENAERGTRAALGPHEIALLDLFGTGRRVEEVLDILLPGGRAAPRREEAAEALRQAVARLVGLEFLVAPAP